MWPQALYLLTQLWYHGGTKIWSKEIRNMKNRVTRFCICAALCVIVGIAFTACGGSKVSDDMTPSETVSTFLDAFKAQDEETMNKVYAGDGNDFMSAYEDGALDKDIPKELLDSMMAKWYDFDYKVNGKTATVDVTITTYDMVSVFNNFYTAFMERALDQFSGNSNNVDQEEYTKMAYEVLQEELDKATEKTYEGDATLSLTKTDGKWLVDKIDENNKEFLNVITGGLMEVLNDIVNTMGADEGSDD